MTHLAFIAKHFISALCIYSFSLKAYHGHQTRLLSHVKAVKVVNKLDISTRSRIVVGYFEFGVYTSTLYVTLPTYYQPPLRTIYACHIVIYVFLLKIDVLRRTRTYTKLLFFDMK